MSEKNEIIEKRIEYLIEDAEESNADYTTIFDQLSYFFDRPLNLNNAQLEDLEALGLLGSFQINNLLAHREKNGKLITLEELQTVEGFDLATIRLILPFVKVASNVDDAQLSLSTLLKDGEHQLFMRYQSVLEEKKGFGSISDSALLANPSSRYVGSVPQLYVRYRYNYGRHVSVGFTAEKDAGEEFFTGSQQQGFDFYSAHLFVRNQGKLKQLALGDYQAQFGQGLTYWSGRAFGKSSEIMLVKRSAQGLIPYTSVDESRFLRGGGTTFRFGKVSATTFYSHQKMDANIIEIDSLALEREVLEVSSIQQTGLHRTVNELEDKDAVSQEIIGGNLMFKTRKLSMGLTGVNSVLNTNFTPTLQTYSQFRNRENKQTKIGADYNWVVNNFNFFGEFSKSIAAGNAFVTGALVALDPKISVALLYRNYDRDFQPIASAGIGEGSTNENEKGMYIGVVINPVQKIMLSAYYDQFTFPWLKYRVNSPSNGYQYLGQLTYKPSKKMELYIRIRERDKLENTSINVTEGIDYLTHKKQTNYRFQYTYKVSDAFRLRGRVELINYDKEELPLEKGYLMYQDVTFKTKKMPVSFAFRYAIFDTESFNTRIYAYENDVLYAFSIPAYSNRGIRTYLTLRYKMKKGIDLWLRYALTYYDNLEQISSGLEEIQGNHKQEIKAQLRLKF